MKTKLLLFLAFLAPFCTFATQHMVTVADFSFTPASIPNVHIGDTVMFMWSSGSHTTTSTSVPSGAAAWDRPITSGSPMFMYVPTVAGSYSYKCTPHQSMGMTGSFTVLASTGVGNIATGGLSVYPNPASASVRVKFSDKATDATVQLFNAAGAMVSSGLCRHAQEAVIDLSALPAGIYSVRVQEGGRRLLQQIITKY